MTNQEVSRYEKYIVEEGATLRDALEKITANNRGSVVVRGSNGELLGVLSDGDVRRALLAGALFLTPVIKFTNANPIFLNDEDATPEKVSQMFGEMNHIQIIPVVSHNRIVKIEIRNV